MNTLSKTAILRRVIHQSLILIAISLIAGMLTLERARLPAGIAKTIETREKEIPSASIEQMQEGVAGRQIICIDARSAAEFEKGHIRGAISLPLADFDQSLAKNLALFSQNKPIIIYCGGEGCDLSDLLAQKLTAIGMDQVSVFAAGWTGWKTAGFPSEP